MESCWTRVPYASLVAALLMLAGISCFCGTLFLGVDDVQYTFNSTWNVHKEVLWMGEIKILLTISGVVMGIYGIILLAFGVLSTGSTRHNVFSGAKCILGGRCTAIFFMFLTYIFNLAWIAITSALAIPVLLLIMLRSICDAEFRYREYQPGGTGLTLTCFNITRFGLYFPGYNLNEPNAFWHAPALCTQSKITDFCESVNKDLPLFSAAFGSSFVIVVALVSFLMILSVNYQRIKTSKELTDYREALEQDTAEMDNIISSRNSSRVLMLLTNRTD